jgi:hypothetical protein
MLPVQSANLNVKKMVTQDWSRGSLIPMVEYDSNIYDNNASGAISSCT